MQVSNFILQLKDFIVCIYTNKTKYGDWAIVTGASDGIGRSCAIELAKAGYSLILVSRRHESLENLGKEMSAKYATNYLVIAADLSNSNEIELLIRRTSHLKIGLFVAAAGFGTSGRFTNSDLINELNMLDVNCRAVVYLTHHFARKFSLQKHGGIILFSSLVAFQGTPLAAHYAATKAFIQTFAEGLHFEMRDYGVDVLSVAPGPVDTGFAARSKMTLSRAEHPDIVAKGAFDALGKQCTVRPGFLAKLLGYSLITLPRSMRTLIMASIMRGMTK
jgi:short-subunit dehydrogenase